ncbi:MAG: hypothetical protein F6Q11_01395 [Thermoplasma sp.]|nr:MAG: hypothetical protein F6Q11_01395 [Thermoplasma sp.]
MAAVIVRPTGRIKGVLMMKYAGNDKAKDVEALNREVKNMRKELDDVKEVLRGLIQVIMSREDNFDDDEYN